VSCSTSEERFGGEGEVISIVRGEVTSPPAVGVERLPPGAEREIGVGVCEVGAVWREEEDVLSATRVVKAVGGVTDALAIGSFIEGEDEAFSLGPREKVDEERGEAATGFTKRHQELPQV